MKFPLNSRPAACVSDDKARVSLTMAHVMPLSDRLKSRALDAGSCPSAYPGKLPASAIVATDGHTMSIVPADLDVSDVPGPVGEKELEAARKATPKKSEAVVCKLDLGTVQTSDGASIPRATMPDGFSFPDVEALLTAPLPEGLPRQGVDGSVTLALDLAKLNQVVEALSGAKKGVAILTFMHTVSAREGAAPDASVPAIACERMVMVRVQGSEGVGVVMPFRV